MPIVNRLEEQYSTEIAFVSLNAADNADGQAAFEELILRGHPAIVIFDAAGQETYRGLGSFDAEILEAELNTLLE